MIEKCSSEELDSWRAHPVTMAFVKTLRTKRLRLENDLRRASIDATIERVRKVGGALELLDDIEGLIDTRGEDD